MEVQTHGSLGIGVLHGEDLFANLASHAKFLIEFTRQARVVRFARFALAARELPFSCEVRTLEPARHEKVAVALDDGGQDDDGRGQRVRRV